METTWNEILVREVKYAQNFRMKHYSFAIQLVGGARLMELQSSKKLLQRHKCTTASREDHRLSLCLAIHVNLVPSWWHPWKVATPSCGVSLSKPQTHRHDKATTWHDEEVLPWTTMYKHILYEALARCSNTWFLHISSVFSKSEILICFRDKQTWKIISILLYTDISYVCFHKYKS